MTAPAEGADVLHTVSGVSAFTGDPFVHLQWGHHVGQLSPEDARTLGLHIIECADAAVTDALVVKRLRAMGYSHDEATAFVLDIRTLRDER